MSKYVIGVVEDCLETETQKTNSVERYYIDYGTGTGNEWVEGTLDDAKQTAAEGVTYTQTDAVILADGEEVARLVWCGCPPDDDIDVVVRYGDFGFYYWA